MQHFCFLKLFQCLSFGTLSVGSCIPLTPPYPSSVQGFVLFWVLSDTTSSSRLIFFVFSVEVLESFISARSSHSFLWRMVLETKIWTLEVLIAVGVLLLLSPLR